MAIEQKPMITLSGPLTTRAQARKTLQQSGFEPIDQDNPTGLPDTTTGDKDESIGFLTVIGDDLDHAGEILEPMKWVIRGHHQGLMDTAPSVEQVLNPQIDDAVEQRLQSIEQQLGIKRGI